MEPFIALLSVGLFVVGGILGFQHYREQEARDGQRLPNSPVEMARIEEEVRITLGNFFEVRSWVFVIDRDLCASRLEKYC